MRKINERLNKQTTSIVITEHFSSDLIFLTNRKTVCRYFTYL